MEELNRLRLGGVVIHMKNNNITYLIGSDTVKVKPLEPYAEIVCDFLNDISKQLRSDKRTKEYSDVVSLAFWCRKSNIVRLGEEFSSKRIQIGRGLVFHITPSNVPVNFAFSFFFGLLSGNANVVRVPSKEFPQITIICDAINEVIKLDKYRVIRDMTTFITYQRNDEITAYYSSICDARIIWGGDDAIQNIRKFPMKVRAVEIVFADRYSLCIINSKTILEMNKDELKNLAEKFYNDTYLMDQNACSTPHLILWYGDNDSEKELAKKIFWDSIHVVSQKYDLTPIKSIDKYTQLCHLLMDRDDIKKTKQYDNSVYTVDMNSLPEDVSILHGKFGLFYQYDLKDLDELIPCINLKVQTLIYVGMNREELVSFVIKNHLQGIDRIVPMGEGLNIGVYWDGYDIINNLSRSIE